MLRQECINGNSCFDGPIFVIGMPRSGTKLLRNLLSTHSKISIANVETEFFPYLVANFRKYGDLSSRSNFSKFYSEALSLPYFTYQKNIQGVIEEEEWFGQCESFTPSEIFEILIRHDTKCPSGSGIIWGDKSPSYIERVPLLKEHFPNAKFVLIVRDVRDYCLSINTIWGKNKKRAAQRWTDSMLNVCETLQSTNTSSIIVKYEDLIEMPKTVMADICKFLHLEFEPEMLELSRPVEKNGSLGDTKSIVVANKNKYCSAMSDDERNTIEKIAKEALDHFGYPNHFSGLPKKLSQVEMVIYQVMDGVNLIKYRTKKIGIWESIRFYVKYYLISGNRS
jgi:hypothetical protein